ncbi:MAG: hypothetical protein R3C68_13585 [Myxococcota bacterium]
MIISGRVDEITHNGAVGFHHFLGGLALERIDRFTCFGKLVLKDPAVDTLLLLGWAVVLHEAIGHNFEIVFHLGLKGGMDHFVGP